MSLRLQALADRLDDGDAAGHRRLEVERHAIFLGERGEARAVMSEQRLVGGDDVLAGTERGFDRVFRHATLAAHQFDEHVDAGIGRQCDRVVHATESRDVDLLVAALLESRHGHDLDRSSRAGRERVAVGG